jgi:hypothetical protein
MAWTPPSKFIVTITFLLWGFGIFILLDQWTIFWTGTLLPIIHPFGLSSYISWLLIAMIVFFFSWFLFFLGVTLKGL